VFFPNYLIVQEGKRKRELHPAGFPVTPGIRKDYLLRHFGFDPENQIENKDGSPGQARG
jgi:hypothetical protein